jgi:hypothetical protein
VSFRNFSANSVKLTPALSNALMFTPIGPSISTPLKRDYPFYLEGISSKSTFKITGIECFNGLWHIVRTNAWQKEANSLMSLEKPRGNS